ncbi:MAG: glycogen/starch/alpha-glucan phosphorylase [Ruminococcaceae bacterium]|nr:glycogen/starch/alpha-glucan phosphorylase [Oscillospiraceae bacterium]
MTQKQFKELLDSKLSHTFGLSPEDADVEHIYKALALVVRDMLQQHRIDFTKGVDAKNGKRIYYLSMEYLMGRSLRNNLFNLGLEKVVSAVLPKYNTTLESVYNQEPDAGLGNGGLGRLAACFLDGMASQGYCGFGYSLRYEFGIFSQKMVEGWQTELPDFWLPGGSVWLVPHREDALDIHFGGRIEERFDGDFHRVEHTDYTTVRAVPYDMMCAGVDGKGVSTLRLWAAEAAGFDIDSFNRNAAGMAAAVEQNAMAEMLTKVLYPNDNHPEGKSLRLSQQYFLVSSSIQDIIKRHLRHYRTMDNFTEVVAIHINDTHPALAIPELMRVLIDECGWGWDEAWDTVTKVMAYTNHTVMPEALECWSEELFKGRLPRIYQIVCEINRRFCEQINQLTGYNQRMVDSMSIFRDGYIKMANLCIAACHSVNGVSELHSDIIKDSLFSDFYAVMPHKFKNVTNGIAHRRWLNQSNPRLAALITDLIGNGYIKDASKLSDLLKYQDDKSVLEQLAAIKRANKEEFAAYIKRANGIVVNPDSIFDVQVKRLHEYKRQHLNAMHILSQYLWLRENPNAPFTPKTYIFGAKAASGYFLAKRIIQFISYMADVINNDPLVADKLKVVFLENYRVTVAEMLMPASEISEQISLASTEASGTGNMKFMLNGALTLGTEDGANVEIHRAVGDENIIIFGMSSDEVKWLRSRAGEYNPRVFYDLNPTLHRVIDTMRTGFNGMSFGDIADHLLTTDSYMAMGDFESYVRAQAASSERYADTTGWNRSSLINIANAGIFAADRAVDDYARDIWHASKNF